MIDLAIAAVAACVLVVVWLALSSAVNVLYERRMFRLFATCCCPTCRKEYSFEAIKNGLDTSPDEELWSDGINHTIHCCPVCRCVVCGHCGHLAEIRYNRQGEFFGPRLAVNEPQDRDRILIGKDGRPTWTDSAGD